MRQGLQDMHLLQELVLLHRQDTGAVETARLLNIDRDTERKYRNRLRLAGLLEGDPDLLPELALLREAVKSDASTPPQERSTIEPWSDFVQEKLAAGLGPTAIHGQLRERFPAFQGSLSAVKRLCKRLRAAKGPSDADVAIPVHTAPGRQAQVDFGYVGKLLDPATGKHRKAWVFVMILSHSRQLFARIVFRQDIDTWLQLHREAFAFFGGVVEVMVPDNLKSAVLRAAFGASELAALNRSYREFARYYGFKIDPTPAYSPKKKGKVESAVKYVKGSFFKPRADVFVDVHDANQRLEAWLADTANARTHGTTGRVPGEVLRDVEQPALKRLPDAPFVPVIWHHGTVAQNAHVSFRGRFYSVPWTHLGKKAWVRVTGNAVAVYVDDVRVADHRLDGPTPWSTVQSHLPKARRELAQRDPAHWYARADALGEDVGAYIRDVMASDDVLYPLRRVQAIVPVLEGLTPQRACSVARRAARYACFRPDAVRRIVALGLDLDAQQQTGFVDPGWAKKPKYARQAEAFLTAMEVADGHLG